MPVGFYNTIPLTEKQHPRKLFLASGLTVADFARLMGVARQTASGWVNGHHMPCQILGPRYYALLDLIYAEVEAGRLPLRAGSHQIRSKRLALNSYLLEQLTSKPTA